MESIDQTNREIESLYSVTKLPLKSEPINSLSAKLLAFEKWFHFLSFLDKQIPRMPEITSSFF